MNFDELYVKVPDDKEITVADGQKVSVKQYLPIDDKAELIKYIIDWALDTTTGCFSPIRTEVFFSLAVCRWYAGIEVHDNFSYYYDVLETWGILDEIMSYIPEGELRYLRELVDATVADVARYNNSAAGLIQMMNTNAEGLDSQLQSILSQIKNGKGLEQLAAIKDVVGND